MDESCSSRPILSAARSRKSTPFTPMAVASKAIDAITVARDLRDDKSRQETSSLQKPRIRTITSPLAHEVAVDIPKGEYAGEMAETGDDEWIVAQR